MSPRTCALGLVIACSGCMTAQTYQGPRRDRDEVAHIRGDYRVTAGAPVTVILRQVDGRALTLGENAVEVLPGPHRLLADCRIAETGTVTRHSIEAEVVAGRQYRLVAQTAPGLRGCTDVGLAATEDCATELLNSGTL